MEQSPLDWFIENLPERFKNAILNTCQDEIKQAKEKEKEANTRQLGVYTTWLLKHYSTHIDQDFCFGWQDSMRRDVSTKDIIDHYFKSQS